jgi:hypothetical protein
VDDVVFARVVGGCRCRWYLRGLLFGMVWTVVCTFKSGSGSGFRFVLDVVGVTYVHVKWDGRGVTVYALRWVGL